MGRLLFLIVAIVVSLPAVARDGAVDFTCPEKLEGLPEGWSPTEYTEYVPQSDGMTVFDGPPDEMASLVPDNEPDLDCAFAYWTFPARKPRSIWMRCSYTGQVMHTMRALPDGITKCTQTAAHTLSCE